MDSFTHTQVLTKTAKVKTILVSQPAPSIENSPYNQLIEKRKVNIDFRPFIHVEGVSSREVRLKKIDITQFSSIIFTSRNAVDHFFRLAEELRFTVPSTMRYFCQSEAVAYYLQKYVVYRKRKIYVGKRTLEELLKEVVKFKYESFLLPCSDRLKPSISEKLDATGINWTKGVFYKTVISDLSDLRNVYYDILVFFSPSGIESLFHNFANFEQNETRIAVFGTSTKKAALDKNLRIDILAPTSENPSMTKALDDYIVKANKR
jgi:uroporphyrinogen-III synthase